MLTSFTVDRSRWLHGEGVQNSMLLRPADGKMCCMGFLALAAGIPEADIKSVGALCALPSQHVQSVPVGLRRGPNERMHDHRDVSALAYKLMGMNDIVTGPYTGVGREVALISGFAEIGIELKFEGEYPAQAGESPSNVA